MATSPVDGFLLGMAANLATDVMKAGARCLADATFGDAEVRALHRVYRQAFVAMLDSEVSHLDDEMQSHISELLLQFVVDGDVNQMLLDIALVGSEPQLGDLHKQFESLGYNATTLPLDFDHAMSVLVVRLAEGLQHEAAEPNSPLYNRVSLGRLAALTIDSKQNQRGVNEILRILREIEQHLPQAAAQKQTSHPEPVEGDQPVSLGSLSTVRLPSIGQAGVSPISTTRSEANIQEPQPVDFIAGLPSSDLIILEQPFRLELIRVPSGEFLMGSSDADEAALSREKKQHKVPLDTFWISRHVITIAQFSVFVEATGHKTLAEREGFGYQPIPNDDEWPKLIDADWRHPHGPSSNIKGKLNHPVTQISWDDATRFCTWLSRETGKCMQLPTEAQWEKAARGLGGLIYPWGDSWDAARLNSSESSFDDTTPVGLFSPAGDSTYGVSDMAGNVWELTCSIYKPYPYQSEDGREDITRIERRVIRGGSWKRDSKLARCAYRSGDPYDLRSSSIGFRVVYLTTPCP